MEFRTVVKPQPLRRKIDHSKVGLSLGSCFAQSIAQKMQRAKLPIVSNPFGILYNPASIAHGLEMLVQERRFSRVDLVKCDDVWCSFLFHGRFSAMNPRVSEVQMNKSVGRGAEVLNESDYIIITFGTAWVYELREDFDAMAASKGQRYEGMQGKVVANCHKFPASDFRRRCMSVEEIVEMYDKVLSDQKLIGKQIIMTVSPVRHLRDGAHENTISKAILLLSINELASRHDNVEYFPSFEIMNDELRDYRFYGDDMVHPSQLAVEYIWERFCDVALTQAAVQAVVEFEKIATAVAHRPINSYAQSHKVFLSSMLKRVKTLQRRYPNIDMKEELEHFSAEPEPPDYSCKI